MGSPNSNPSSDYSPSPPLHPGAQVLIIPPELSSWTSVMAATLISCLDSLLYPAHCGRATL